LQKRVRGKEQSQVQKNTTSSPGNIDENLQDENTSILKDETLIALWWPCPGNPQDLITMDENPHKSNMHPQKDIY
jgi:hypothetical protein